MLQALALLSCPVVSLEQMVSVKLVQLLEDIAAFLEEPASTRSLIVSVERFLFCSRVGHLVKHCTVGRAGILMLVTVQDPAVWQLSCL